MPSEAFDRVQLPVSQIPRNRTERMHIGMRRDQWRVAQSRHIPKAFLIQMRQIQQDAHSSLQRRTNRLPASVSPGPVSGVDGNAIGTPCAKMVGRLHTMPSERKPA